MHTPRRTLLVSLLALLPAAVQAGSPLTCFPMPIGDTPSLAWGSGSGWNTKRPGYDTARLAEDTLALLGRGTPVLVRMETLRRAALYAAGDAVAAGRLLEALRARAAAASARPDPLAQFDLGYAVESYRQARSSLDSPLSREPPEDGYALVRQALSARGPDPEMEYAAALMTLGRAIRGISDKHLKIAIAGTRAGSPLARTLEAHRALWGDRLQAFRAASAR
jgi:hypothetical protein